jgi:branched-chain amino acid transport system substrate-binding protein
VRHRRFRLLAVSAATLALASSGAAYAGASSARAVQGRKSSAHATTDTFALNHCGLGNGKVASGTPIPLGAIVTNQPGTSFTDITNAAQAYFTCVNHNGGIYGHPIKYYVEQEQTNPSQVAADATKLIQTDHVDGIVGNTSIIDCAVNGSYYKSKGFYIIDSGIASQCYGSSYSATVNMGPRYSSDGAAQYVIAHGAKKIVFDQSNVPGTGYNVGGIALIAKADHIPLVQLTENVPITDANSVAEKEVQEAGPHGAVVLNFTPPEALVILQAAQKLGLENRVMWACSTPCNTNSLAAALGPAWNGKLFVNAELSLPSASGTDLALYRKVMKQYAPSVSLGSFSEMGFLEAEIATSALLTIHGPYTPKTVNAAFVAVKNFNTSLLCKPWYYLKLPVHLPNNTDRTVTPDNGKMVLKQGCEPISAVEPVVKYVRGIEKKLHLN